MEAIHVNKLVLFGAGKIGRSFIGQLFSTAGYEVVFIDINKTLVNAINLRGQYKVIIKSDKEEVLNIKNVRGVFAGDSEEVIKEVASAGIIAVSVGREGLDSVFPLLARALEKRQTIGNNFPLDIIIAENMRDADVYFRDRLTELLPLNFQINKLVGLVETSIGKMVPIMTKKDLQEDILQIIAEPYNTLILNKNGFRNPIPSINGLAPKENMKAWVDRKLFIHNLGHSAAAYIGYLHDHEIKFIYEALAAGVVHNRVREAMLQAADILLKKYPEEFSENELTEHIDDLLIRFQNKALGDTVFRVGCDLLRKLGSQDRLAGAIKTAIQLDLPYEKILFALVSGCHFRATDVDGYMFKGDIEFVKILKKGLKYVLKDICGFNEIQHADLFRKAELINLELKQRGNRQDFKISFL